MAHPLTDEIKVLLSLSDSDVFLFFLFLSFLCFRFLFCFPSSLFRLPASVCIPSRALISFQTLLPSHPSVHTRPTESHPSFPLSLFPLLRLPCLLPPSFFHCIFLFPLLSSRPYHFLLPCSDEVKKAHIVSIHMHTCFPQPPSDVLKVNTLSI